MIFKEMMDKEYVSKELSSSMGIVHITKERNIYNALRKKYMLLAKEAAETFSDFYKDYRTCNDILKNAQIDFQKSIAHSIDEMKNDLISVERYDLDYDTIYEFANDEGALDSFYEIFDEVSDQIISVHENLEERKAYREDRKENRGRWQGGTFSVGGSVNVVDAYANQARMATMNAAEGAAYAIFNAIGNAWDTRKANNILYEIFKDPNTKGKLRKGVYNAAFQLHYALIALILDSEIEVKWDVPNSETTSKSNRLLNNLKSGAIPKEKANDLYLQVLELDPYNMELFEHLFDTYGDKKGELGELADHFSVDLQSYKDKCALDYIKQNKGKTEEDAVKAKDKLYDYCEEISLIATDDLDCMQYINKRLYDFDRKYRTVDEVVCETRDGADFAREELGKITEFMEQVSAPEPDSLLDYEEDLLEKKKKFEETFSSELKEKYMGIINEYLEDFDSNFCSYGLFKSGDRKEAGQERLYSLVKKQPISTPEEIEQAYTYMLGLLPKVGLKEQEAEKTLDYLTQCKDAVALQFIKGIEINTEEEAIAANKEMLVLCEKMGLEVNDNCKCAKYINKRLNDYDLQYRTVDGVVCETRDGADFARDELKKITEFMEQVSAPTPDSLLDYEQDLLEKKKTFEETFSSELKEKYLKKLDAYLNDFDKKFCSLGMFKSGNRKQAGQEHLYNLVKIQPVSSAEEIEKAYEYMHDLLPKVGLEENEAVKTLQYLDQCKDEVALQFVKNIICTTEEEAVEANQKLLALCEKMGLAVNDDRKCMQYINKLLADFDLKYRTIEGIVCDTREEAGLVYSELDQIHDFMSGISAPTAESLLDYEEGLITKRKLFDETFTSKIKAKYLSQIDTYLADFDKKFCTSGFMKKVDRKQAGQEKALKFAKKVTGATLEEAYQQLDEFLPKVGLSRTEAQEAVQYLQNKFSNSGSMLGRFFRK